MSFSTETWGSPSSSTTSLAPELWDEDASYVNMGANEKALCGKSPGPGTSRRYNGVHVIPRSLQLAFQPPLV